MDHDELLRVYTGARSDGVAKPEVKTVAAGTPAKLRPKHLRIVALHAAGWSNYEIAEMLGVSESYIPKIINHPLLQDFKQEMAEEVARSTMLDARTMIQSHTMDAAMKLVELMESQKDAISLRASESILDRGGIPKADALQASQLLLDKNEMADLRQALDDIATEAEEVADVEESHTVLTKMREGGEFLKDKAT